MVKVCAIPKEFDSSIENRIIHFSHPKYHTPTTFLINKLNLYETQFISEKLSTFNYNNVLLSDGTLYIISKIDVLFVFIEYLRIFDLSKEFLRKKDFFTAKIPSISGYNEEEISKLKKVLEVNFDSFGIFDTRMIEGETKYKFNEEKFIVLVQKKLDFFVKFFMRKSSMDLVRESSMQILVKGSQVLAEYLDPDLFNKILLKNNINFFKIYDLESKKIPLVKTPQKKTKIRKSFKKPRAKSLYKKSKKSKSKAKKPTKRKIVQKKISFSSKDKKKKSMKRKI